MRIYFHTSRKEYEEVILGNGLKSTDTDECPSIKGIHVAQTIEDARERPLYLRENETRDETYVIFALKADTSVEKLMSSQILRRQIDLFCVLIKFHQSALTQLMVSLTQIQNIYVKRGHTVLYGISC
jgi:hypothetical protein